MPRDLLNLFDYEARAREIMPRTIWNQVYYGAYDEVSTRRIRPAFESILLRPKMLRNVADRDTSTTVLGQRISVPVMPAPPGHHQKGHPDGELATARAAASVGTGMLLSHYSNYSMEEVAAASDGFKWFQLYVFPDRDYTRETIQRAEDAGYSAIVLTVSAPASGMAASGRDRDTRTRIIAQDMMQGNLMYTGPDGVERAMHKESRFDASITWDILDWIRSVTSLPVVVKGICSPEDGRLAAENGAAGVVVSTHAARLFDGPITTIEALPYLVDAVAGRCEVYLDGGVRRGIDVLKALALGARACMIGKPLFYALAVDGENGVRHILEILRDELDFAMAMCGARTVDDIDRSLVSRPTLVPF
jgi:isopentenyl diphosphate isomerase/L-lactate dehydrogenase-like FMN-dependent dehydrogenase